MEGDRNSFNSPARNVSKSEKLQKQHEEKMPMIQELKRKKGEMKLHLENKKKEVLEEKLEGFKNLTEKYNSLRDEYNALLAEKPQEPKE